MALKKSLKPTYDHKVEIPVPGSKPEKCGVTYRYMTESEYDALKNEHGAIPLVEFLGLLIDSWDEDDFAEFGKFSTEALKELSDIYPGAPNALLSGFLASRHQGRLGN